MRRLSLLFAVLLVLPLLGSGSPREYDDRVTPPDNLEGTWQRQGWRKVLTCHRGTWTLDPYDGNPPWHGTYRADTTHKPAHLDRYYADGQFTGITVAFIYEVNGDVLRIGYFLENYRHRPQGFDDEHLEVSTYKRVK